MAWFSFEDFGFCVAELLDGLERRFEAQRFELFRVIICQQPIPDVAA